VVVIFLVVFISAFNISTNICKRYIYCMHFLLNIDYFNYDWACYYKVSSSLISTGNSGPIEQHWSLYCHMEELVIKKRNMRVKLLM